MNISLLVGDRVWRVEFFKSDFSILLEDNWRKGQSVKDGINRALRGVPRVRLLRITVDTIWILIWPIQWLELASLATVTTTSCSTISTFFFVDETCMHVVGEQTLATFKRKGAQRLFCFYGCHVKIQSVRRFLNTDKFRSDEINEMLTHERRGNYQGKTRRPWTNFCNWPAESGRQQCSKPRLRAKKYALRSRLKGAQQAWQLWASYVAGAFQTSIKLVEFPRELIFLYEVFPESWRVRIWDEACFLWKASARMRSHLVDTKNLRSHLMGLCRLLLDRPKESEDHGMLSVKGFC